MEFFFYLTPEARDIVEYVIRAKYQVRENIALCTKNKSLFGYTQQPNKFVMCTKNIINSGEDVFHYVNETVYHESVHIAQYCNNNRPLGIPKSQMPLDSGKLQDIRNSIAAMKNSNAYNYEHEAYWMEDKPEKVKYVIQKYCF